MSNRIPAPNRNIEIIQQTPLKTRGVIFLLFRLKGCNKYKEEGFKVEEKGNKERDFIAFQVRRKVTNLYKNFLFILEDMQDSGHDIPEEVFQRARKRVLDYGNDTIREIEENLDQFDIRLK
jgi:hypothetical protein